MRRQSSLLSNARLLFAALILIVGAALVDRAPSARRAKASFPAGAAEQHQSTSAPRKVKGRMQTRPGGPIEDVEVAVEEAPGNLPAVPADQAALKDDDLVLGIVANGKAMAYPVRYLGLYEVVDDRVGQTPVAPTW